MNPHELQPPPATSTIERLGDCTRRVTLTVSPDEVKRFRKRCRKRNISSDEQVADVMIHLLATRTLPEEAVPSMIDKARSVGVKPVLKLGKPFTIVTEVDTRPDFDKPDLDGLTVLMPEATVTDEDIDAELLEQCRMIGSRQARDGAVQLGDSLSLQITLQCHGDSKPLAQDHQVDVTLVEQPMRLTVEHVHLKLAHEDFVGKGVSSTIERSIEVPENADRIDLAGQTVTATITIAQAQTVEPATIADVVAQYEAPSEANLRMQVRTALEQLKLEQQKDAARSQVLARTAQLCPFLLPPHQLHKQRIELINTLLPMLIQRGYDTEEAQRAMLETLHERIDTAVARKLRTLLFVGQARMTFGIPLLHDAVSVEIGRMAQAQGKRPAELREELAHSNLLHQLEMQAHCRSVADWLLEQVECREVPLEVFEAEKLVMPT